GGLGNAPRAGGSGAARRLDARAAEDLSGASGQRGRARSGGSRRRRHHHLGARRRLGGGGRQAARHSDRSAAARFHFGAPPRPPPQLRAIGVGQASRRERELIVLVEWLKAQII